jgi:hypothetical protein
VHVSETRGQQFNRGVDPRTILPVFFPVSRESGRRGVREAVSNASPVLFFLSSGCFLLERSIYSTRSTPFNQLLGAFEGQFEAVGHRFQESFIVYSNDLTGHFEPDSARFS